MNIEELKRGNVILAFDTATLRGSVAVGWDVPVAFEDFVTEKGHAGWLLPHIDGVIRIAGLGKESIVAVAVGTGPGNFTGIKVAVSSAKGISYALRVPLVGISSLDVLANSSGVESDITVALLDAKRGMMYCAFYGGYPERRRMSEYMMLAPDEIYRRIDRTTSGSVHFVGEVEPLVKSAPPEFNFHTTWEQKFPDARVLVKIARDVLEKGMGGNPFNILPVYLKKPV